MNWYRHPFAVSLHLQGHFVSLVRVCASMLRDIPEESNAWFQ